MKERHATKNEIIEKNKKELKTTMKNIMLVEEMNIHQLSNLSLFIILEENPI